ncbi:hypothetical protein, partial [Bifidobacterium adolescentis]|uniref:hypothetical protein n=1 Tax=Bifidobacterium adolescentis TaxID=1680 RepID=UPI0040648D63
SNFLKALRAMRNMVVNSYSQGDALAPYMAAIGEWRDSSDSMNRFSRVMEKDCSSRKLLKFEKLKSISIWLPRKYILLL